jgi:hypothetical protein
METCQLAFIYTASIDDIEKKFGLISKKENFVI